MFDGSDIDLLYYFGQGRRQWGGGTSHARANKIASMLDVSETGVNA